MKLKICIACWIVVLLSLSACQGETTAVPVTVAETIESSIPAIEATPSSCAPIKITLQSATCSSCNKGTSSTGKVVYSGEAKFSFGFKTTAVPGCIIVHDNSLLNKPPYLASEPGCKSIVISRTTGDRDPLPEVFSEWVFVVFEECPAGSIIMQNYVKAEGVAYTQTKLGQVDLLLPCTP